MQSKSGTSSSNSLSVKSIAVLATLAAIAAAGMIFLKLPDDNQLWGALQNTGHFIVFFILSITYLALLNNSNKDHTALNICITVLILATVGIAVELLQLTQPDRESSIEDLLRNFAGSISGVLVLMACRAGRISAFLSIVGVLVVLFSMNLSSIQLLGYQLLKSGPPYVIKFDDRFVESNISSVGGSEFAVIDDPTVNLVNSSKQLRVGFNLQQYNGVIFQNTQTPWVVTDQLVLDIYNPQSIEVELHLRIHDSHHNNNYNDRFNTSFRLIPGNNQQRISIRDIELLGNNNTVRPMDLENIRELQIFSTAQQEFRVQIKSIYTEPGNGNGNGQTGNAGEQQIEH